jgi:hypothetical protein
MPALMIKRIARSEGTVSEILKVVNEAMVSLARRSRITTELDSFCAVDNSSTDVSRSFRADCDSSTIAANSTGVLL